MNSHRDNIKTAKQNLLIARAALEVFNEAIDAEFPMPTDCPDHVWDAWNDQYEDARCDRGGYGLEDAHRAAEDALIAACRAALAPMMGEDQKLGDLAFSAALGEGGRYNFKARRKVLDLCLRLNPASV